MKNRYVGLLTVEFADGYVERCVIKEKSDKGEDHFIKIVYECAKIILAEAPKGKTRLKYKGDCSSTIADHLKEIKKRV